MAANGARWEERKLRVRVHHRPAVAAPWFG